MMAVVGHFPLMGCQRQTNLTPATVYLYIYIYRHSAAVQCVMNIAATSLGSQR